VLHTLQKLAEVRQIPIDQMAAITNANFFRLFSKVPAPAAYDELPAP
jgi:Tat protein secretion system quality control protein TatD with DNase activity